MLTIYWECILIYPPPGEAEITMHDYIKDMLKSSNKYNLTDKFAATSTADHLFRVKYYR